MPVRVRLGVAAAVSVVVVITLVVLIVIFDIVAGYVKQIYLMNIAFRK